MCRFIAGIILLLCVSIPGMAQKSLTGRVVDENSEPMTYATVALLDPIDSTLKYFGVTNDRGKYQVKIIASGDYIMQFSFVGMETIYDNISLASAKGDDLGDKMMYPTSIDEVIVVAEYVPITFKSDTVEFNAKAFSTKPHAVVEDLLKKIPGIEVDPSGNMKALGEDVTKVLVDGKEFFGKDPKVATKNLPAIAIEKVQVYDKKSEESEFTGIDDGTRDRTINLLLNEEHKKGYFGNAEAGVGTGEHLKLGAQLYRFSSKIQAAALGMYNNINEFGYSGTNVEQFGKQIKGLNKTGAGGLNLSYNKEKNNRYFISYLGSITNRVLEQKTSTENFLTQDSYYQVANMYEDFRAIPQKINLGVRHTFNPNHKLIFDGDIIMSFNDTESHTLTNSRINDLLVNNLINFTNNESDDVSANLSGSYIAKLNAEMTQIKTGISATYNKNSSVLNWNDTIRIYNPDSLSIYYQYQDNNTEKLHLSIAPTLVQKIAKFWYFNAGVKVNSKNEKLNRQQEITEQDGVYVDSLLPQFKTNELIVDPNLSLVRNSNKSLINFTLAARWSQFEKVLGDTLIGKPNYLYFLPGLNYEYKYRTGRRITFRYRTYVSMPNINQLYPVTNTLNLLSLYKGNIDLTPEYNNHINFSWWLFDQFSFTSFFWRLGSIYTKNKISMSQTTNEELIKLNTPVNVPYNYVVYSFISFSTPIRVLGIKMNINWNELWNRGIGIINTDENIQTNFTHTLRLNIENRKKDKWDVLVGGQFSMTDAKFSISSMNTIYFNTSYYADIRFTPNEKWSFQVWGNVTNYNSESFSEAVSIPIINASISYFFLKGNKGSFLLKGSDLLNKNIGFYRNSTSNYLVEQEWNTIGRYVMLTFKLRIGR